MGFSIKLSYSSYYSQSYYAVTTGIKNKNIAESISLLESGDIGEALNMLKLQRSAFSILDRVSIGLLSYRHRYVTNRYNKGTITDEMYTVTSNQIVESLLHLLISIGGQKQDLTQDRQSSTLSVLAFLQKIKYFISISKQVIPVSLQLLFVISIFSLAMVIGYNLFFPTHSSPIVGFPITDELVIDLHGHISDKVTGQAIKDAKIIVGTVKGHSVSSGKFILPLVRIPNEGIEIRVKKSGYATWSDILPKKSTNNLQIKLQASIRILISDFKVDTSDSFSILYAEQAFQSIKTTFVKNADIEVVARGEDFKQILEEIHFVKQNEKIFDPEKSIEMGKAVGANYLITGEVKKSYDKIYLQVELLDIEKILFIDKISDWFRPENVISGSKNLSHTLLKKLPLDKGTLDLN